MSTLYLLLKFLFRVRFVQMCQFAVCLSLLAIIWRKVSNNSAKEGERGDCSGLLSKGGNGRPLKLFVPTYVEL